MQALDDNDLTFEGQDTPKMAPNLADSQHVAIHGMIEDGTLTNSQAASVANCSERTISASRTNYVRFGSTKAPYNGRGGRPRSMTPLMLDDLLDLLREKHYLQLDEMAIFLWDRYDELVSKSTLSRALAQAKWSRKVARRIAHEQCADLRDMYLHDLSFFEYDQLLYVDETGSDKRIGYRRTGWSPLGVTPVQIARFQRGQRYHILPAYTHNGVLFSRIYQGTTDRAVFERFLEHLLPRCGRFPERHSVLVMDNASFHHGDRIQQMCDESGVKLLYLPPYSPDLNPIEQWFAQLKAFIKKNFHKYVEHPGQDFGEYLQWCVDTVGSDRKSARGHFRHAGWKIPESDIA